MRFIDISILNQVLISSFYIIAIILEIGCAIIAFLGNAGKKQTFFFMSLILISSIQMFMMIEILYEIEWGVEITEFTRIISKQNVILTVVLLLGMIAVSVFYGVKNYRRYKREISFNSIKEAFDNLPKAISIVNQKGIPVLVNKQMYDLVYMITKKDFQIMDDIIDILNRNVKSVDVEYINIEGVEHFKDIQKAENIENSKNTEKTENTKNTKNTENTKNAENTENFRNFGNFGNFGNSENFTNAEDNDNQGILIRLKDKSIWQIKQKQFQFDSELFHEISASEITPIYDLSHQLQEKNRDLKEQKKKQEKLLRDMIKSKKEEEILNLKIDTHSKFGKAILATQLFLDHYSNKKYLSDLEEQTNLRKSTVGEAQAAEASFTQESTVPEPAVQDSAVPAPTVQESAAPESAVQASDIQEAFPQESTADMPNSKVSMGEISPIAIWQDVIQTAEDIGSEQEEHSSSLNQLIDASQVFGCKIILDGELPKDDKISYLIVTAMREAITNAVRHAKADELRIQIRTANSEIKVEIEDNSNLQIASIKETGGLADLRKKIEKSGGKLQILCDTCVKLIICLPIQGS